MTLFFCGFAGISATAEAAAFLLVFLAGTA
jgi:hypothetical protein